MTDCDEVVIMEPLVKNARALSQFGETWVSQERGFQAPPWVGWSIWAAIAVFTVLVGLVGSA